MRPWMTASRIAASLILLSCARDEMVWPLLAAGVDVAGVDAAGVDAAADGLAAGGGAAVPALPEEAPLVVDDPEVPLVAADAEVPLVVADDVAGLSAAAAGLLVAAVPFAFSAAISALIADSSSFKTNGLPARDESGGGDGSCRGDPRQCPPCR